MARSPLPALASFFYSPKSFSAYNKRTLQSDVCMSTAGLSGFLFSLPFCLSCFHVEGTFNFLSKDSLNYEINNELSELMLISLQFPVLSRVQLVHIFRPWSLSLSTASMRQASDSPHLSVAAVKLTAAQGHLI